MANLLAIKPLSKLLKEAKGEGEASLKRSLGPLNLVTLGVGAIIGAGIFVLTGQAAAKHAGPAVMLSFIVAGITCAFAGLCYAEFASLIPIAGSAYTYGYATLGEFVAWIIGWGPSAGVRVWRGNGGLGLERVLCGAAAGLRHPHCAAVDDDAGHGAVSVSRPLDAVGRVAGRGAGEHAAACDRGYSTWWRLWRLRR